jgi:hypothetical protein
MSDLEKAFFVLKEAFAETVKIGGSDVSAILSVPELSSEFAPGVEMENETLQARITNQENPGLTVGDELEARGETWRIATIRKGHLFTVLTLEKIEGEEE